MHWKLPLAALLASGLGLALSLPTHAQEPGKPAVDSGIKAQLAELDYQYEVDEDNDFKLVFEVGEEGRSQIVYILSAVETYGAHKVREIWSPAYESATDDSRPSGDSRRIAIAACRFPFDDPSGRSSTMRVMRVASGLLRPMFS